MRYVSFTYDPIGNVPFAMSVYESGKLNKYGFYESGKEWANQKDAKKPEWMASTSFFQVSDNIISSVINQEFDYLEIKSLINKNIIQNHKHSLRQKEDHGILVSKNYPLSRSRGEIVSFINSVEYRALSFLSDQKKKSPISAIRQNVNSSKSGKIINTNKAINLLEIKSALGRGQSRRLGLMISSLEKKSESSSRRAVRRADNIAGIEYEDISESSIRNRIINSSIERLRRF